MAKQDHPGTLSAHAFRLKPHQDLKVEIMAFAKRKRITAGCIISCVGSLTQVHLRFANRQKGQLKKGHYEITALSGTFSGFSAHLHLTVADKNGKITGGHLLGKTLIFTTAEIVVGSLDNLTFERVRDDTYGYHELSVKAKRPKS